MKLKQFFGSKAFKIIIIVLLLSLILFTFFIFKKNKKSENSSNPFADYNKVWVDSMLNNMTFEEKIGQIVMFSPDSLNIKTTDTLFNLIENYKIGSTIILTDSLNDFVNIFNDIQSKSKIPIFIVLNNDISFPLFKDIQSFPNNLALNSISDDSLVFEYYNYIAETTKKLGFDINFYNNENLFNNIQIIDTNLINNKLTQIKYFVDSLHSKKQIAVNYFLSSDNKDFNNFLKNKNLELSKSNLGGFYIDTISKESNFGNFKKDLNYTTLNFLKINSIFENSQFEIFIKSDFDILILKNNYIENIKNITELIKSKKSYEIILNEKVKKILMAKSWTGLEKKKNINLDTIKNIINNSKSLALARKLFQNSIILAKNNDTLIPIKNIETQNFNVLTYGNEQVNNFETYFKYYSDANFKFINRKTDNVLTKNLLTYSKSRLIIIFNNYLPDSLLISKLILLQKSNELVILNFGNIENLNKLENFKTIIQIFSNSEVEQEFAAQLIFGGIEANGIFPIKINNFLSGFGLKTKKTRLKYGIAEDVGIKTIELEKIDSIINKAIQNGATPGCQVFVAKNGTVIYNKSFGYHTYSKQLPVIITDLFDIASMTKTTATTLSAMKMYEQGKIGLDTELGNYFKDTKIEYTRIKPDTIINVDTLELKNIKDMKKLLKYQDTIHLTDSLIVAFDTIIAKATPSLNIFKVTPRQLLMHKSGISPAMPILRFMLYKDSYLKEQKKDSNFTIKSKEIVAKEAFNRFFSNKYIKDSSEIQIADNMFLNNSYFDTLWIDTKQLRVYSREIYQYSDVNMILLQQAIDSINGYNIDIYLKNNFFKSLGLKNISYLPLENYSKDKIIPTEQDKFWRNQLLHGYVHDPSAAMMGGIAGNAGLFASAQDVGIIYQMLLNGGTYGGTRYLQKETIDLFTRTQDDSNRGLGFDKPSWQETIIAEDASPNSYGHTGFTGCCVWVDPDSELVYIFLSNRVHPSADNWKLNNYKIRQNIHQAVYEAIEKGI